MDRVTSKAVASAGPDFLGIGAQRCGTTWLDSVLRMHPEVYLPVRRKEIHYFDRFYERGPVWYAGFFPEPGARSDFRAIGEITPAYLYAPEAASRIAHDLPESRLIAILRDPIDRAYSQYALELQQGAKLPPDFIEYLDSAPEALDRSRYAAQLEPYLSRFHRTKLLVLVFEEIRDDTAGALAVLAQFLGLQHPFCAAAHHSFRTGAARLPRLRRLRRLATRVSRMLRAHDLDQVADLGKRMFDRPGSEPPRLAPIPAHYRRMLAQKFEPEIARLEHLLGRDFSQWRRP